MRETTDNTEKISQFLGWKWKYFGKNANVLQVKKAPKLIFFSLLGFSRTTEKSIPFLQDRFFTLILVSAVHYLPILIERFHPKKLILLTWAWNHVPCLVYQVFSKNNRKRKKKSNKLLVGASIRFVHLYIFIRPSYVFLSNCFQHGYPRLPQSLL